MLRALTVCFTLLAGISYAQKPELKGDYAGMLGPYHIKLHLVTGPNGGLTGTADNTDMAMVGMACENLRADGQTLSFTVPAVHGTWTGIVSADGASLSGMWSQGASPMQLNFTRAASGSQESAASGPAGANAQGEVKWDDYVFKFLPGGSVTQVFQGGRIVGQILTFNGQQQVTAMPGTDAAKLRKSYQDYLAFDARSHGGAAPANTTPMSPAAPAPPAAVPEGAPASLGFSNDGKADSSGVKFEGKTVIVPRTDGMQVTFAGDDVTISSARGPMFILRRKKASVGRTFEQALDKRNAVGGGVGGAGIEFLRAQGGLIYDSGMGGYNLQESPGVRMAKQLALVAVDAVAAVRQIPGHTNFKPSSYDALKDVSQYRLRSDGSR